MNLTAATIKQHLIDPEICIRCNTCEVTCPVGAITHDSRNYVVDADKCESCLACISPCPTGAIDNWRAMPRVKVYSIAEQLLWDELPVELTAVELAAQAVAAAAVQPGAPLAAQRSAPAGSKTGGGDEQRSDNTGSLSSPVGSAARYGATEPPWSAAQHCTKLYGPAATEPFMSAKVVGNVRVTEAGPGQDYDTHHIVLDFGTQRFPVLEGQSIGILPPEKDDSGRPHHARQYSVASPRNGERPGYNNLSLTIKRVLEDHQGRPVRGVASNYMCDLKVGDEVRVIGPFGASFLMPNHPRSSIVMICTGTGSAPMRAMTEWRRRLRQSGKFEAGKLMLFFGARTQEELPYFGPLQNLLKDFIDINFAFSRIPGSPKLYVQDLMRERASDLALMLADPNSYFYVCGLKSMEEGVLLALRDVAQQAGLPWEQIGAALKSQGRLHLETY